MAASVLPTRWAFEGLLLLESGRDPRGEPGGDPPRARDLAAVYFPEETERMGVRAGTIALGAMLIGLAAGAAFLSEGRDGG
jgi:hypothetical protein